MYCVVICYCLLAYVFYVLSIHMCSGVGRRPVSEHQQDVIHMIICLTLQRKVHNIHENNTINILNTNPSQRSNVVGRFGPTSGRVGSEVVTRAAGSGQIACRSAQRINRHFPSRAGLDAVHAVRDAGSLEVQP